MSTLLPIEKAAGIYCLLTLILMAIMGPCLADPAAMLVMRAEWLAMTVAIILITHLLTRATKFSLFTFHFSLFTRTVAQLAWLILWYPDTYEFNRSFPNLDHHFAAADAHLFGCQPSLEFSQALPSPFWSEAFNLGYWSYYPMIAILVLTLFIKDLNCLLGFAASTSASESEESSIPNSHFSFFTFHFSFASRVATCILLSFFLFYLIYIFLPVAGPQYYFRAVGIPEIMAGHFPSLGTYFSSHLEALAPPGWTDGLFYQLVAGAQEAGERPTAAFPSSHIGISTIVLFLARRHAPRLLFLFLPLWALLCCATVYIRAHYLVDAIAGLICAPLVLWGAERICRRL